MVKPNSIVRWLEHEFGDVTHAGENVRINCPFCPVPDTKQHMYVSIVRPVAHCFRCDWAGTHFKLVRDVTGAESFAEVEYQLQFKGSRANLAGYKPVAERLKGMFLEEGSRPRTELDMPEWFVPFNAKSRTPDPHASLVLKYALKRMTVNNIIWHSVGYCKADDQLLRFRLVFPIEGDFWQARAIGNGSYAKYISPPMEKGDVLFNYVALQRHPELFVAEGVISALALGPNAVAIIGKSATEAQALRIARSRVDKVTIAFDAGTAFSKGVTELADVLASYGKEVIIRQYAVGDPDSCELYTEKPYSMQYKVFAGLFA